MPTLHAHHSFEDNAARYEAWYDNSKGQMLLGNEVVCLKPMLQQFPKPYLEVGVGTGRFAETLDIEYGVDPSLGVIRLALRRGIKGVLGIGEALPFRSGGFGGVLMAFTLCFVQDPRRVVEEVHRVLVPHGGLVLGLLFKGSPWAEMYRQRGEEGDPLYKQAYFHSRQEVEALLEKGDFRVTAYRSTLFQPPGLVTYMYEKAINGYNEKAGFVAAAAVRSN